MTATGIHPVHRVDPPTTADVPAPVVRIRLKPRGDHRGMVDGAWWPRSRDLSRELPPLIAALEKEPGWGPIHHAKVNLRMWPGLLENVQAGNHVARMAWFEDEQDPHDICLLSLRQRGRWDLLVVPPELEAGAAASLMVSASTPGTSQSASALLATALARMPGQYGDPDGLSSWESEGGSARPSAADARDGLGAVPNPHACLLPVDA